VEVFASWGNGKMGKWEMRGRRNIQKLVYCYHPLEKG